MTIYETISIVLAFLAIAISLLSIYISNSSSNGNNELFINQRITDTKNDVAEKAEKLYNTKHQNGSVEQIEFYEQQLKVAIENNLNAYDTACGMYRDRKIDKKRFKKTYKSEIKQLVEGDQCKEFLHPSQTSKFKAIHYVYNEWEDLER